MVQPEVKAELLKEAAEQRLYGAMSDTRVEVDKAFAGVQTAGGYVEGTPHGATRG